MISRDVGVNLAVCNQRIAQAFVAVLNDGELAVLFHHGTFDGRDFVDAGGAEFEHEVVCADAVFHTFIGLDFAVDDNPDGFAVNYGFDPAVVVLMNFRLKTNSVHKISTRKNCNRPTLSLRKSRRR